MTELYDRTQVADIPWPATADGDYARRVLVPLLERGPQPFIRNIDAEVQVLIDGDQVLPVVLAHLDPARKNAYVTSPTTHYIDYPQREVEIEFGDRPLFRHTLPHLLSVFRPFLRWGDFERVVFVNNWLLSTNLYVPLDPAVLRRARDLLRERFPDRAIIFRSVNERLNGPLCADLEFLGFRPVFSRQVYILDPQERRFRRRKAYTSDRKLARETHYRWGDSSTITPTEYGRVAELYDDLYLHKYSHFNPQFTPELIRMAVEQGWFALFVLRDDERIDAVAGFVERAGVMTTPLVGYDRSLDPRLGLYRLITIKLIDEAAARGLILHQSSGAAAFKRHRGFEPAIEHNLVFSYHLPPRQQLPWRLLELLSRTTIIPLMQHYRL